MVCLLLGQLLADQELSGAWDVGVFIPGSSLEQGSSSEVTLFIGWGCGGINEVTESCP